MTFRLILLLNVCGSTGEKARAAEVAAGKRPQVEVPPAAEDLRDSGSSKLRIGGATGSKLQPDPLQGENVSIPFFLVLLLLFPLETDVISALQVVVMMASEIVKAHQITERQRDDALGTIRKLFRLIVSFALITSYCLLVSGCRASSPT